MPLTRGEHRSSLPTATDISGKPDPARVLVRVRVDLHAPPADLDQRIDWFDAVCERLVLLEDYSLEEIRSVLDAVRGPVLHHCRPGSARSQGDARTVPGGSELLRLLVSDHERFRTSMEQLEWFYSVLVRENHGGHRQAFGQYGRVFAESFRRHRLEERAFARRGTDPSSRTLSGPAPRKGY